MDRLPGLLRVGAWRISSADLGRDLEEDLSIAPRGVQDFGEEKKLTPIDVLLRFGNLDLETPQDAAL
jgi:hypothetical protein